MPTKGICVIADVWVRRVARARRSGGEERPVMGVEKAMEIPTQPVVVDSFELKVSLILLINTEVATCAVVTEVSC